MVYFDRIKLPEAISAKKVRKAAEKSTSGLWEDPDFPADATSLFVSAEKPNSEMKKVVRWARPREFLSAPRLFIDGASGGDVVQGGLGDCWLLGALSVVATRPELLSRLFVHADAEHGFYQVQFFKVGRWVTVTIDDRLPLGENGKPAFGHCKTHDELWVALVEKAYAKLHGSYEALIGGATSDALVDMTGGAPEKVVFAEEQWAAQIADGSFWLTLRRFADEGFLMGAAASGGTEEDTGKGILSGHAYGVTRLCGVGGQQLVQCRNPWGMHEWTGAWSDNAPEWTPELLAELDYEFADDGTFFMSFADFCKEYSKMYVCRLYDDDEGERWRQWSVTGAWEGATAGGCMNEKTWVDNPQLLITTTVPDTNVYASVIQEDVRMLGEEDFSTAIGYYMLKHNSTSERKAKLFKNDIVGKTAFVPAREVAREFVLQPGEQYVLLPCTFKAGDESPFILTLWAEHDIDVKPLGSEFTIRKGALSRAARGDKAINKEVGEASRPLGSASKSNKPGTTETGDPSIIYTGGIYCCGSCLHRMQRKRYHITTHSIEVTSGMCMQSSKSMQLIRATDIAFSQCACSCGGSCKGWSKITVLSTDKDMPRLTLEGLDNARVVFERLRDAIADRQRGGKVVVSQ